MLQGLLSGILVGGVYGLFSMGFSLAFGVMRIVNFAHGDMVMWAMFIGYFFYAYFGIDPLYAMPFAVLLIALLGAAIYIMVYRRFVGAATLQQLLVAIAISLILQIVADIIFSPDTRGVRSTWASKYLLIGDVFLNYAQIVAFGIAVISVTMVELVLRVTRWGQTIRAVADDVEAAELVGIDTRKINVGAFALASGLAGLSGIVLITNYPVSPHVGFMLMPIALIATVIGGLGSVSGAFVGGLICGILQQITSVVWNPALQDLPLYGLLIIFLTLRPYGLFGRASAH